MAATHDVVTMGRVGVDLYPQQTGVGLEDVASFAKFLGGSPTNVAVAAARYGRKAAVITKTGADPFGKFVRKALQGYGVDDSLVGTSPELPTPVTFCEIFPPDDFPLYFYRLPKAPDLDIHAEELDLDAIRNASVFWVTVTGLCQEPSRSATLAALEARSRFMEDLQQEGKGGITVLDLDYRPMFWDSPQAARDWVKLALPHVTVAVGNREECEVAVGAHDTPAEAAQALRAAGVSLAVVKQGPKGVLALDDSGQVEVPPAPVQVVNGLGAGDAFGGALVHGLLAGWGTERIMRFANAAGALVAGALACSDAMPTQAEVERKLQEASDAA
ncbi:5-dehydro-2-deoxygluconokinase [Glycomyces algeriensis]|uniref:5-dehydro-2-deoxygluconokinase n=1 Tax=Glycomyces algeriensis TaxID=256037 RepID=UPI0022D4E62C|nr:5-dehydro-2-deoxygluconokinase [Glycomyces algeriensis]MDA1368589.1 5-dehydro-2-deoxygluconokinase [Glycomyces algeriensis]MDR7352388.1 5-dehydro-2-deoxygluconokinase [Glycomyces algeriensis]